MSIGLWLKMAPTMEELMKQLDKLNAEVKRLKAKDKKGKKHSSSSEDDDSSFKEEVYNKGKKERKNVISPLITLSFNYDNMPSSTAYTSIPIGKAPYFDGSNYNQWKYCVKNYLYSISPEVWQVVCDGVDFLKEDKQPTLDQLQKIYRNAQSITILISSVDKEEFNRVDGLDEAKEVWTTLRMAHEGSKPMRKAKIDMLEGQLNRFVMFDNETPQDMFNHLKKLVNKAKALGSKKWTDRMLTEHMMRAYTPMNYNVVAFIRQDLAYKRMSSDDVLAQILNHEMYIEEVNHVKNLSKGITTTRKQEIAFKANKKRKNKQMVDESSSEEEEEDSSECDAKDMALFMKKFMKYIKKKKFSKEDKKFKSTAKGTCYNCGKHDHFIANCHFEHKDDDDDDKKKSNPYKKDKGYKRSDKPYKKKFYGEPHIGQEWESNNENSNSDSDGVVTVAIKGTSSSNKSLFSKLNKGKSTCLMAEESKHKVKTKGLSSPKYVSSDDDTPFPDGINENGIIKRLGKELVSWDQLLEIQEDLLEHERKSTCELKKLLSLEKVKHEEFALGK
jgi:hypothetical protein